MTPKREEKKEAIFTAALALFSRYGFGKTTIEAVARETGMTKGNLYFYVKNKEDLYRQTIHWALTRWQAHVARAVEAAATPEEKFVAMAQSALAYIEDSQVLQNLLKQDPELFTLDRKQDRFPAANQAALDIIRGIIHSGIDAGAFSVKDPDAAARYLFSVYMMFLIRNYVYLDRDDFFTVFEAALEITLNGLCP